MRSRLLSADYSSLWSRRRLESRGGEPFRPGCFPLLAICDCQFGEDLERDGGQYLL